MVALGNLGLNAVLDFAFYRFGTWGIPLSTARVQHRLRRSRSSVLLHRRLGGLDDGAIASPCGGSSLASALRRGGLVRSSGSRSTPRSGGRSRRRSCRSARRCSRPVSPTGRPVACFRCASCRRYSPCGAAPAAAERIWTRTTSATSRSSRTSTTASRRSPIASSSSRRRSRRATCATSCSTRWTSSASAGSRSRRRPSACTGRATS